MSKLDNNISPEEKLKIKKEKQKSYYESIKNTQEFKEKKRKQSRNYYRKRMQTDPVFKENFKNHKKQYYQKRKDTPEFIEAQKIRNQKLLEKRNQLNNNPDIPELIPDQDYDIASDYEIDPEEIDSIKENFDFDRKIYEDSFEKENNNSLNKKQKIDNEQDEYDLGEYEFFTHPIHETEEDIYGGRSRRRSKNKKTKKNRINTSITVKRRNNYKRHTIKNKNKDKRRTKKSKK